MIIAVDSCNITAQLWSCHELWGRRYCCWKECWPGKGSNDYCCTVAKLSNHVKLFSLRVTVLIALLGNYYLVMLCHYVTKQTKNHVQVFRNCQSTHHLASTFVGRNRRSDDWQVHIPASPLTPPTTSVLNFSPKSSTVPLCENLTVKKSKRKKSIQFNLQEHW